MSFYGFELDPNFLLGLLLLWLCGYAFGVGMFFVFPRLFNRGRFNALREAYLSELNRYRQAKEKEIEAWQFRLGDAEAMHNAEIAKLREKYESMLDDERARCDKDRDEMMRIMNDLRANIEQAQEVRQTQLLASEDAVLEI